MAIFIIFHNKEIGTLLINNVIKLALSPKLFNCWNNHTKIIILNYSSQYIFFKQRINKLYICKNNNMNTKSNLLYFQVINL